MALIWAKGQKLQELCGKTTTSKRSAGVNEGNRKIKVLDKQKDNPALRNNIENITPNSPDLIRTAIPMNSNTKGVISVDMLKIVF